MTNSFDLKECAYGKAGIRLIKVERCGSRHELKEIRVDIRLFGDFEPAYRNGDNGVILPTDSMKNAVFAFARRQPVGEIEDFGSRLAGHFLSRNPHAGRVHIVISENIWGRIDWDGVPHENAFQLFGPEQRVAVIDRDHKRTSIRAGVTELAVLKTAQSAFENFLRDDYTTLEGTRDRLLETVIRAEWSYTGEVPDYGRTWCAVLSTLLYTFAGHDSRSIQHTLCAMAQAVLEQFDFIDEITLSMPNRHCLLVDLSRFSLDNPNEVFAPIDEPNGLIEATLRRPSPGHKAPFAEVDSTVSRTCFQLAR